MTIKSFGALLVGIGIFGVFVLFSFSEWNVQLDFIENIRYAKLIEIAPSSYNGAKFIEADVITLGQGLLLPLFVVGAGLVFNRELIEPKLVIKNLPFLK